MAKKKRAGKKSTPQLEKVSYADLQKELERRQAEVDQLQAERHELEARLAEINGELSSMGVAARRGPGRPRKAQTVHTANGRRKSGRKRGRPAGSGSRRAGGGRRPRNEMNLVESLQRTLSGKTMSVTEAAEAVQKNGYKTTSPNFRTIVNQTLIKNRNLFSKQGRGLYTAK